MQARTERPQRARGPACLPSHPSLRASRVLRRIVSPTRTPQSIRRTWFSPQPTQILRRLRRRMMRGAAPLNAARMPAPPPPCPACRNGGGETKSHSRRPVVPTRASPRRSPELCQAPACRNGDWAFLRPHWHPTRASHAARLGCAQTVLRLDSSLALSSSHPTVHTTIRNCIDPFDTPDLSRNGCCALRSSHLIVTRSADPGSDPATHPRPRAGSLIPKP